jgi:hypothetical protein
MTVSVVTGFDATGANEHLLPLDKQAAGYDTQVGTGFQIRWTPEQFARHTQPTPALHIDQDPGASDFTADYLDVEAGAASNSQIPMWVKAARTAWARAVRPGQRRPGIYTSRSNVTAVADILVAANLTDVPLIVANFGVPEAEAVNEVANGSGPFPIVGFQFDDTAFGGAADADAWSLPWLTNVSRRVPPPQPATKEQDMVIVQVRDAAGHVVTFTYDGTTLHHIVSPADQDAFAKVLPVVPITTAQFQELSGGRLPP